MQGEIEAEINAGRRMTRVTFAVELKDLRKSFGKTEIIRGADLAVNAGERVAIIGPNGAGKSTLFNLISGRFGAEQRRDPAQRQAHRRPEAVRDQPPRAWRAASRSPTSSPACRCSRTCAARVLWSMGYRYAFWKFLADLKDANERADELLRMIRLDKQARRAGDEPDLRRAARARDRHHDRRRRERDPARRADRRHEPAARRRRFIELIREVTSARRC